ncbi:ATP-dependent RNA helicase HrpA [Boudabousia tangfeifanii]|uniref:ATP-dependent RNA helicase HrpA n=2 Tax=Boudabousia tangfeifanii TaxID=1912795 RepID=A0A1D9MMR7_9ACTO|nr:ATP-dependent RNA helicase HrpA [Boudabousia tangfeifanii]
MIGHTQPRRLAARAVATRIADELGTNLGELVGYQVRFTDQVSDRTLVKLMTDGILLAEIQGDPLLQRYDTIIVDEAHERSLNIDFLLGYLSRLLPMRPDLKVIITSATIDAERFAEHFASPQGEPAPIITVSGRTYPVEIRYRPLVPDQLTAEGDHPASTTPAGSKSGGGDHGQKKSGGVKVEAEADLIGAIVDACDELMDEGEGDILVFLPGERDIRDTDQALADHLGDRYVDPKAPARKNVPARAVEVLPLYARLSAAEQQLVFAPHTRRRIVLSTNVAETSLTVPSIRYVVDPGLARISRYSTRTKVQRLPIEAISQASANQRSGRCGRVADGIAIRLYSQEDFEARPEFTEPEILRTSLASVILQMSSLGLGKIEDFPFVQPPDGRSIRSGVNSLLEIGALVDDGRGGQKLTKIGRTLARLPIDPRLGRMLLEGAKTGCATEVGVIVAALSIQDVRERPIDHQGSADELHARFIDPKSDFITYLNLWRYVRTLSRDLSGSAFRRTVKSEFLHYLRIREWQDIYAQLRQLAKPLGIHLGSLELPTPRQISHEAQEGGIQNATARACVALTASATTVDADAIHQALLVGLLSNLGSWAEKQKDYEGARGVHFTIWPGSGLAKGRFDWVMAAELVETSRLFARTVGVVKPEWIEAAGSHLLRRVYAEPFWSRRGGAAMVHEKVMLYGLTVVADRQVPLGKLGQQSFGTITARGLAREMFIHHALAEGDWSCHHKFWRHNQEVLTEIEQIASRVRNPALVPDALTLAQFYEDRIPPQVTSAAHFNRWWKDAQREDPHQLDLSIDDLLPPDFNSKDFPDYWVTGDLQLPVTYQHRPGRAADGMTIKVPLAVLPTLRPEEFEWLVPGMRADLVTETIRALPKPIRRQLVPAPQFAEKMLPLLAKVRAGEPLLAEGALGEKSKNEQSAGNSSAAANAGNAASSGNEESALEMSLARLANWAGTKVTSQGENATSAATAAEPKKAAPAEKSVEPEGAAKGTGVKPEPRFAQAFRRVVSHLVGAHISKDDWALVERKLPDYVRPRFSVVASDGRILGTGPELTVLQKQFAKDSSQAVSSVVKDALAQAMAEAKARQAGSGQQSAKGAQAGKGAKGTSGRAAKGEAPSASQNGKPAAKGSKRTDPATQLAGLPADWQTQTNLSTWPQLASSSTQIPPIIESVGPAGVKVRGYVGLAPNQPLAQNGTVRFAVAADPATRDRDQVLAVSVLAASALALSSTRISTRWSSAETVALSTAKYANGTELTNALQFAAARSLVAEWAQVVTGVPGAGSQVRSQEAFEALVAAIKPHFEDRVFEIAQAAAQALSQSHELSRDLREIRSLHLAQVAAEIKEHQQELVGPGFILRHSYSQLPHLARYLAADRGRLAAARTDLKRDERLAWELATASDLVAHAREEANALPAGLERAEALSRVKHAQELLEEFRVQLFAQTLGTAQKTSLKRIRAALSGN